MSRLIAAGIGLSLTGCALASTGRSKHAVTPTERLALIERAQVWIATDVSSSNVARGPREHGFPPGRDVSCTFTDMRYSGNTPKFACVLEPKDVVKVRYGEDNGEVYAGVAATRLLWALGFGTDPLYPVHVVCRGCPERFAPDGAPRGQSLRFDIAAIERQFPGKRVEVSGDSDGWSWDELDRVNPEAGGATRAQRDALKLLAVFLQHSDNKADQQRLVCRDTDAARGALAACREPFLLIHDVGMTFGRANLLNRASVGSVNLEAWTGTPIWKDADHCIANLAPSQTGTLSDPFISEDGRTFLAGLLAQLSDRQIHDLFAVARFEEKPQGSGPIDAWVAAFKHKRDEIASASCR